MPTHTDDIEEPILYAAQDHLTQRYRQADETDDWKQRWYLNQLVDVADYLRRVALPTASDHYRAEKSGHLAAAADEVQKIALIGYAGWPQAPAGEGTHPTERAITEAFDVLGDARRAVRSAAYAAGAGQMYQGDADTILAAARQFTAWAQRVTAEAIPDTDDN